MEKTNIQSVKLQMTDILIPGAKLTGFDIVMNEETKKFFDQVKKKQEDVLKLKEVNEEQLRTIIRR